jgi:hypothetical protein
MTMKGFLISFTLIAFVTVSCAGSNKVGWTRRGNDFRQDKFEEDRKWCIQIIDPDLHSEAFGQALEECLGWQGYKYESPGTGSSKQASKNGKTGEWGKPDLTPAQFEEDQQECRQGTSKDGEHPVTVAECLAKKGYTFEPTHAENKERPSVGTVLKLTTGVALIVGLAVVTNGAAIPLILALSWPK